MEITNSLLAHANVLGLLGLFWAFLCLRSFWWKFLSRQGLPKQLPWAGARSGGVFSRAKAALKSFLGLKSQLLEGYSEYSKQGKSFILPNIINGHEVIIPPNYMSWILEQPDSVLSQYETNLQFMRGDYTLLHTLGNGWNRLEEKVKREMTRDLDDFADDLVDEIEDSLKGLWGSDTETWHEINVYDIMLELVGRAVNRVLVGLPLCRHPGYLQASTGFNKYVLLWSMGLELLPTKLLQPLVGPLMVFRDRMHYRTMRSFIAPLYQERAARLVGLGPDATLAHMKKTSSAEPNDYIQWTLRDAIRHGDNPYDPDDMVTERLAVTSFTAIQSSAITITNALIDLAATPSSAAVQDELRAEVAAAHGVWTRASLARLPKIDSVLTETLRLWGILTHGVTKAVVAPGGITIPTGEHVPCGAKVSIASYGPHVDEQVYGTAEAGPLAFDPFRFTRPGVAQRMRRKEDALPGLGFVTTSEHYMGFSHGRHAWYVLFPFHFLFRCGWRLTVDAALEGSLPTRCSRFCWGGLS